MHNLKILIADDEEDLRDIMSFLIESNLQCEMVFAVNGVEAIGQLSKGDIDLIICDYNMPLKNGGDVYQYLLDAAHPCRYVMCSSDSPGQHEVFNDSSLFFGYIQKPLVLPGLKEIIAKLTSEETLLKAPEVQSYTAISTKLLLGLSNMPSEVFIKLSDSKYFKVFDQGAIFDETDFIKYSLKGIDKLYALNISTTQFIEKMNSAILSLKQNALPENKVETEIQVHRLISSTLKEYGFQEELMPSIEAHFKETLDLCKSNKTLSLLLDKLLKNKDSYLGQHSFLMSAITVAMAARLEWASSVTAQKLVVSSLFHDIFLPGDINNEVLELMKKNNDEEFLTHPQKAADLLDKLPGIQPDTSRIILEHHEIGDGYGFPREIEVSKTTPLSQLFIFSHYLVDIILDMNREGNLSKEKVYEQMEVISHSSSKYRKLLSTLREIDIF